MRRLLAGTTLVLVLGGLVLPASAHNISYSSGVTIHHPENSAIYHGRVFSDLTRCQRGRTIKLIYAKTGEVAATTATNSEGRWRHEFIGTAYYAKVTRKVIEVGVHRHVCLPDTSRTVTSRPARARRAEQVATKVSINDFCEAWECRPAPRRNYTANFYGRVKSAVAKCERGRTVKVVNTDPTTRQRGSEVIGTVTSESDGTWFFSTDQKPGFGDYRAKVTRKRKGNVVCKTATSKPEPHDPFN